MNKRQPICVANWKMQMPFAQAVQYCSTNVVELAALAQQADIILCPSSAALHACADSLKNTNISIGAQSCSVHATGAYTGQESAISIAQAGAHYCIVGHSEQRTLFNETNELIAQKAVRVIEQNMCPIFCIGETVQQKEQGATYNILTQQLAPLVQLLSNLPQPPRKLCIAYEPVWAIGTGTIPTRNELEQVFDWLHAYCTKHMPNVAYSLLYGGSVNEKNVTEIKTVRGIDGLLIGGASLDFQNFKNIVSLFSKR